MTKKTKEVIPKTEDAVGKYDITKIEVPAVLLDEVDPKIGIPPLNKKNIRMFLKYIENYCKPDELNNKKLGTAAFIKEYGGCLDTFNKWKNMNVFVLLVRVMVKHNAGLALPSVTNMMTKELTDPQSKMKKDYKPYIENLQRFLKDGDGPVVQGDLTVIINTPDIPKAITPSQNATLDVKND